MQVVIKSTCPKCQAETTFHLLWRKKPLSYTSNIPQTLQMTSHTHPRHRKANPMGKKDPEILQVTSLL
jgi:hypothetical protein